MTWTQPITGIFTNGTDIIRVERFLSSEYYITKNEEPLDDEFQNLEGIHNWLHTNGFPELTKPQIVANDNVWHRFNIPDNEFAFSKKTKNNEIVSILTWLLGKEEGYIVLEMRDTYTTLEEVYKDIFDYAELGNQNPTSDLHIHIIKMNEYGISSMDKVTKGVHNIRSFLINHYGIPKELINTTEI